MKKRGIVLAINSKNNESDVDAVFEKQPAMLLGRSDFVSKKINWQDKASNLKELEAELNLTEGSFVFIDDNPIEREIVAGQCPDALVPEFPEDTTELLTFAETVYEEMFRGLRLTAEDAKKTQMYLSERERKNIQSQSLDLDSYIRLLEIKIDMHRMKEFELERVHQLCNKTNQFNLTTKRYSVREITAMDGDIFTVTVSDKFGEQGLVAVVICKEKEEHIRLDSFLMSCRVMGRKLEYVIIALLARYYQKPLMGVFRRTSKNAPVEYLYDSLGFAKLSETDEEKSYLLQERTIALPDCYRLILFEGQKIETEKR
jgi:FkbH-like protein